METKLLQTKKTRWCIKWMICITFILSSCISNYHTPDEQINKVPEIFPDYSNLILPVNIAPINFRIKEVGDSYQAAIGYEGKIDFTLVSDDGGIQIPDTKWRKLLSEAIGKNIFIRISVKKNNKWIEYKDINNLISTDSIDSYLIYRLLYPGYELWNEMGIYQRNLTNFEETAILPNREFDKQCINCHNFNQHSPQSMMFHVRGKTGGTVIQQNGQLTKVNMKPGNSPMGGAYASWHPNGRYIAFSMNEIQQFFHRSGKKPIEVSDLASNLGVYDIEQNKMFSDIEICDSTYMETFPCWSPDGKNLFFCRAQAYRLGMPLDSIRYDLCKIEFDTNSHTFGRVKSIFKASESGKSVSFPRVSPDGKYLLFTLSDYGNFSIWHPESDLYLLNLMNGNIQELTTINSSDVDSYHSWSSSGKWIVFSSKRMNGLWARPYFTHFNPETGEVSKPFLLPQKNPSFYEDFSMTFNIPEFIKEPIVNKEELLQSIKQENITIKSITLKKRTYEKEKEN